MAVSGSCRKIEVDGTTVVDNSGNNTTENTILKAESLRTVL